MKAILPNAFDNNIFQIVEVLSQDEEKSTIITSEDIASVNTKRLLTIPEFIKILEKQIENESN